MRRFHRTRCNDVFAYGSPPEGLGLRPGPTSQLVACPARRPPIPAYDAGRCALRAPDHHGGGGGDLVTSGDPPALPGWQ